MFCPKCGSQVPDGTKFCPKCGNNLGSNSVPGAGPAPQRSAGPTPQNVNYTPVAPTQSKNNKGLMIGLAVVAVAIVAALVFFIVSCSGIFGYNYVGTWEGTAEYSGVTADCTMVLEDDKSAEMEMSIGSYSESMDNLEWRETDDGIEVATEGQDDWEEFERDGDKLTMEEDGITFELTKK